mmetsp:Transcript_33171/g.91705  ORF Transcript_33171/g.91705 Transcript_33171/m.91705 type:complete len:223 (-) Transcript_33171:236-904(-)
MPVLLHSVLEVRKESALWGYGQAPEEHKEGKHTYRPHVHGVAVSDALVPEAKRATACWLEELRCHEGCRANKRVPSLHIWLPSPAHDIPHVPLGSAKVHQLHGLLPLIRVHDILRLHITVRNASFMQVGQPRADLLQDGLGLLLTMALRLGESGRDLATGCQLHDDVQRRSAQERRIRGDKVWMPALRGDLDLGHELLKLFRRQEACAIVVRDPDALDRDNV